MTPLRLRMTEDMQVRNLSPRTQSTYLHASVAVRPSLRLVTSVAGTRADPRLPVVPHQPQEDGAQLDQGRESRPCDSSTRSPSSEVGTWEQSIPYPKRAPQTSRRRQSRGSPPLPRLCARTQAPCHPDRLLRGGSCACRRRSACARLTSTAGVRVIRIHQGKGRKDRYVMLSPRLLAVLRDYWRTFRPTSRQWLFPGALTRTPPHHQGGGAGLPQSPAPVPPVQTPHAPLTATLLRRSPARSRHRHPHHPTPARPSQPLHHRPHPAPRQLHGLYHHQSTRPAPPAATRQLRPVTRPTLEVV